MTAAVVDPVGLPDGLDTMTGPQLATALAGLLPTLEHLDPHDTPAASRAAAARRCV
jgi:hypothetical protein